MPTIPNKLQNGENWKAASVNAINQIIDYLKSQRIVGDNKTVSITHGVNGVTITAKPQTSAKPQSGGKGETITKEITIDAGAAVPAIIGNNRNPLPLYSLTLYPQGYGSSVKTSVSYSIPTALSYQNGAEEDARIIAFKAYIDSVGGTSEGEGSTS